MIFFGSDLLINEIFSQFSEYYCEKIPSIKEEINDTLLCFKTLIFLSECKLLKKLQWKDIKMELGEVVSAEFVNKFLDSYCMDKKYEIFNLGFEIFDFKGLISEYDKFLHYFGYSHFGKVYTGIFLIWRALLKYFEKLHGKEEFYSKKGDLIEKYCFDVLENLGFSPRKIVIINRDQKLERADKRS